MADHSNNMLPVSRWNFLAGSVAVITALKKTHSLQEQSKESWPPYRMGRASDWEDTKLDICESALLLFSSHSCPTVCNPVDWSIPGFPVLHSLLKFAQTRIYWVEDIIQPSHPLSPPSPPTLNLSHWSFPMSWVFASGGQSIGTSTSALVIPMNIQPA